MITLDIISDLVCPWCYIGKTNFDRAVAEKGVQPFAIDWKPFQLNPDMPKDGMDRRAYYEAKFGKQGAAEAAANVEAHARAAGLTLRLDLIERIPNTHDAHRLVHWARTVDAQTPLVAQLFARYFERGEDIGNRGVLLDAAESIGLERAVVDRLLDGDADSELLLAEEAHAREIGVSGVPTYIVAGKHVVIGAQPAETWGRVIDELTPRASEVH